MKATPTGKGGGTLTNPNKPTAGAPIATATTGNGINYNGGPIMLGTINIYYIWYGNWSGNSGPAILSDFANTLGGSPYFNITTTYDDGPGNHLSNSVYFAGATTDAYSRGTALTDADIQTIVSSAINGGRLPLDTNGVYFVLTSADVNETTGFCTAYCGWHTYGFINGANIKYSFVGNSDRCLSACASQTTSPNSNAGADGMASVIAHELEETATDPNLNAWYDSSGQENGDKCAWNFGAQYTTGNGSRANMVLGSRNFLIQQNWVNASGGYCALSYQSAARVPLYRYYNSGNGDHFYTTNYGELGGGGGSWSYEGVAGYVYPTAQANTTPLYRYNNANSPGGNHFYTTNYGELGGGGGGWVYEGVAGYVPTVADANTTNFYRYYNTASGNHFYTANYGELGGGSGSWVYESVQCLIDVQP